MSQTTVYYLILLASNPALALTRSSSGITLQTVSENLEESQLWSITNVGTTAKTDGRTLEEGVYYINNLSTRTFLTVNNLASTAPSLQAGTESALGNRMAWYVQFVGGGRYMIQSVLRPGYYLTVNASGVALEFLSNYETVPGKALFSLTYDAAGGLMIKSDAGYYPGKSNNSSSALSSFVSTADDRTEWRVCLKEEYTEIAFCSIRTLTIDVTETIPLYPSPHDATFCDLNDFVFSTSSDLVEIDENLITSSTETGSLEIRAVHLPTGKSFNLSVELEAIYVYLVSTDAAIGGIGIDLSTELTGHSFLYFENKTAQTVMVGHLALHPNQGISVGVWGQSSNFGGSSSSGSSSGTNREGVWYNGEMKAYIEKKRFDDAGALCNKASLSQMSSITEQLVEIELTDDTSYNFLNNNCTHFATAIWNTVFPQSAYQYVKTPDALQDWMFWQTGYMTELSYIVSETYGYYDNASETMILYPMPEAPNEA